MTWKAHPVPWGAGPRGSESGETGHSGNRSSSPATAGHTAGSSNCNGTDRSVGSPSGDGRFLLDLTRSLLGQGDPDLRERVVCERLAGSDLYRSAWAGRSGTEGDDIVVRWWAGGDAEAGGSEAVLADGGGITVGKDPWRRAIESGVAQVVAADDLDPGQWPSPEIDSEQGSVAVVPLSTDGDGVLVVHSERENAFQDLERVGFNALLDTDRFASHGARSYELQVADPTVELEFDVSETNSFLARLGDQRCCEFELEGYVPFDDEWFLYLAVDGRSPAELLDRFRSMSTVRKGRVVASEDNAGRVELCLGEQSLLGNVDAVEGRIESAVVASNEVRIVVELPAQSNVRAAVTQLKREYPDATLLGDSERSGGVQSIQRSEDPFEELTDRQLEVVRAAYRSGYFRWPRETTAEELADTLEISPATLHAHLRKAQQSLFSSLFDGT